MDAGVGAHGSEMSNGAMHVNPCQCGRCKDRRVDLGIPTQDKGGRAFPIFVDSFGRVATCGCETCRL
jgi:hypothetical protein